MATIDVLDADGVEQTIERPLSPGRAAAGASRPVVVSTEDAAILGALTETAPASDTASSGLNGRLQRIAQRLTALLPSTIGSKSDAASLAVTKSTEDKALTGALTETAPASDTASSGLNGRLQRIAQHFTTRFPATLGQKSQALSLAVTLSQEDRTKLDNIFVAITHASGTVIFSVSSATSSTAILAASTTRKGASFTNESSVDCYLLLNSGTASITNYTVKIPPDGYYEVPFGYEGAISAIWPSATGALRGTEFT